VKPDQIVSGLILWNWHYWTCCILSFEWFISIWILHADILEHSVPPSLVV